MAQISDGDLLRRTAAGDEEAFTDLYRRFQGPVYRFALQMSGSRSVAEEVTQEVFLALMGGASKVAAERVPLVAWLLGVARNHVLKFAQRNARYEPLEPAAPREEQRQPFEVSTRDDQLERLERNEALERLRRAVLALPPRYREVVLLCELEEMSYEDAAEVLCCAVGTVRSRLHRARTLLAGKLKDWEECPA
jgi:RNA polymerase sigma-70 factor (ECF subfamily)